MLVVYAVAVISFLRKHGRFVITVTISIINIVYVCIVSALALIVHLCVLGGCTGIDSTFMYVLCLHWH